MEVLTFCKATEKRLKHCFSVCFTISQLMPSAKLHTTSSQLIRNGSNSSKPMRVSAWLTC